MSEINEIKILKQEKIKPKAGSLRKINKIGKHLAKQNGKKKKQHRTISNKREISL